jgi:hypothetical protein
MTAGAAGRALAPVEQFLALGQAFGRLLPLARTQRGAVPGPATLLGGIAGRAVSVGHSTAGLVGDLNVAPRVGLIELGSRQDPAVVRDETAVACEGEGA